MATDGQVVRASVQNPLSQAPRARVARGDAVRRGLLAVADVVAATAAVLLSANVIGDDRLRAFAILAVVLVVPISKVIGLYERDEVLIHRTTLDEGPRLFQLATIYALLFWLLSPELVEGSLGRDQVLLLLVAIFGFSVLARYGARRIGDAVVHPERCMMVGNIFAAEQFVETMWRNDLKANLVCRVETDDWTDPFSFQELEKLIDEFDVERVIVAPDDSKPERMLDLIRAAKGLGVRVSILPRVLEVVGSNIEFDNLGGVPLLGVRPFRLSRSSLAVKRTFDALGSAVLLLFAAPLLAAIAIAIKLDSRGPVFFRQTRVGRGGKHFKIVKFRTMVPEAEELKAEIAALNEAKGLFKVDDDPRITRVGRFLRKTSLDELPQVFNVLRGEMSLVGPRPLILSEDSQITGLNRRRLDLTPGMTGHWQVLGSARVPLTEMIKIDYLYVAGWTLWADVKLLIRTVPYVLGRRGQ